MGSVVSYSSLGSIQNNLNRPHSTIVAASDALNCGWPGWIWLQKGITFYTTSLTMGQNQIHFSPFWIDQPARVDRVLFTVNVIGNQLDVGIYSMRTGALLGSTGLTNIGSTGTQSLSFSADIDLPAGSYWMAFLCTSAVLNLTRVASASGQGVQAFGTYTLSVSTLPATMTYAGSGSIDSTPPFYILYAKEHQLL